jgi:trans-2,3-dihydro-3-hydroxyanthranilate isomerase
VLARPVHAGQPIAFRHVDVFADRPYRGNGLVVMFCTTLDYTAEQLRTVTEEMRQFETIFVIAASASRTVTARIFTVEEELPFAGHPVIGAAAALHERFVPDTTTVDWHFAIHDRSVPVVSHRDADYFTATMDQGPPAYPATTVDPRRGGFAAALNLTAADLRPLPLQVISTGLPYLIVPVTRDGLARARIVVDDFEARLAAVGAKFVYVLDTDEREGRTWDNAGAVEDVATGSAAGPVAAYLNAHALAEPGMPVHLRQGRFVGRPSTITVTRDPDGHQWVGGPVRPVASGSLAAMPVATPAD